MLFFYGKNGILKKVARKNGGICVPIKRWHVQEVAQQEAASLAKQLGVAPVVARVLWSRGCRTLREMEAFLSCQEELCDPFALRDMDLAVRRIRQALERGERVAIYGDYDCDGMMATALLYRYLESVGCDVCYYIPERDREGYGLNKDALRRIHQEGVGLVITVDNGITAVEEADYADSLGLDLVITDHHKPRALLPRAAAVVDPHRLDDESGYEYLAGAGVAFKLCCALEGGDGDLLLDQFGDLVATATVADIVPLVGENRLIVRRGLSQLENGGTPGLEALLQVCGLGGKALTSENVAFGLVPRINSAGRFDQVDRALELLVSEEEGLEEIAQEINALNEHRRQTEDQIVRQILDRLEQDESALRDRVVVLSGEGWHHGVVGIVASRMVERLGKPCIVFSLEGENARGSARSVEGFSIIDAIDACSQHLLRYGGHNQAAGLTLPVAALEEFTRQINRWAAQHYPEMPSPQLAIDCTLHPQELTVPQLEPLNSLEPFGCGNETPVFQILDCTLQGIYPIGEGRHLRLRLCGEGMVFYAVYFGMRAESFPYGVGDRLDLAVTTEVGEWNGEQRLSVKVRDLHLTGLDYEQLHHWEQLYQRLRRGEPVPPAQRPVPTREDIAVVYRYLRARGPLVSSAEVLFGRLGGRVADLCRVKLALDILEEMHLVTRHPEGGGERLAVVEHPQRVDITRSRILLGLQN